MDNTDLTEADIEGAALNGRAPKQLTCAQLRFWLSCRGVKSSKLKTKAELVNRYENIEKVAWPRFENFQRKKLRQN